MSEEEYEKVRQQLQMNLAQKQALQLQYNEAKRTAEEVGKVKETDKLYEMIGQILINKTQKEIIEALNDKIEILEIRLKTISKSVDADTVELQKLQKELEGK